MEFVPSPHVPNTIRLKYGKKDYPVGYRFGDAIFVSPLTKALIDAGKIGRYKKFIVVA